MPATMHTNIAEHELAVAHSKTREDVERELREVNTFLDAIVENIPDMIFVKRAEDHMFVRFNRAGENLLGWTREQLIGKTDHDFYPKEEADFFHAMDRATLRSKVLVDVPEEPIHTKAHGLRWLHTKKVPILDEDGKPKYLLGISEDITERKAAEARAHALERELALIVQGAREAMAAWTPDGTIVSWNPAAEAIYGIAASEVIGRNVETIIPEAMSPQFQEARAHLAAGEPTPLYEVQLRRRDGRELDLEISLAVIAGPDGKPLRYTAIARDMTELARLRRVTELLSPSGDATEQTGPISSRMRQALAAAELVARDPVATVLLLGETGVGKGWLARRIHAQSPRSGNPFFEVNCASLSAQLVESELFGHERGAFTGATSQKRGLVEVCEGGTLFLDEIGELPLPVQAQLLTFLDTREFRRVGGTRTLHADVRILAATNVDLKKAADRGAFRRDLYYRLSVVPIEVPPLRERREEIPQLARSLADDLSKRASAGRRPALNRRVVGALAKYDWPGNVRELRNALERAMILARGGAIDLEHLPPELRGAVPGGSSERLDDVERNHILRVLEAAQGNRTRAAEILGIGRSTLKRKLVEYGLKDD
jgi:PAS domain S-box-containing protein